MKFKRVYLENELELFIVEFKRHVHILVFSHWDWSIKNYQILEKAVVYIPSWSSNKLF